MKVNRKTRTRKLNPDEFLSLFDQGLTTLQHLSRVYDEGYPPISLAMATEVQKILTENSAATQLRGSRIFTTPEMVDERRIISAFHKLTIAEFGGSPPDLKFRPKFFTGEYKVQNVDFRTWWNRDVIYRASSAVPGTPAGLIPVNGSPEVPFEEREKITRREFVNVLRNKMGAHQPEELPSLLDDLQSANNWASFAVETPNGVLSTDDGSLPVSIGPMAAMMRQICHELLVAYGREDPLAGV